MRLYNIAFICKAYRPNLNVNARGNNDKTVSIGKWHLCRKALDELKRIKCLEGIVSATYNSLPTFEREKYDESIIVSSPKYEEFSKHLERLKISVDAIVALYDSLELGESRGGLDVKVPQCDSLEEYINILKELNFIFTQCPYITKSSEKICFKKIDIGSQWLEFTVGVVASGSAGYLLLSAIAALTHKALDIKSHMLMCKQQEAYLTEEVAKAEIAQETADAFKKFKKKILDDAVAELEKENGELADGEERDKTAKSIEKMALLLDKGVEVYSSIDTPKDVKALFPLTENNVLLPDDIQKLIEQKFTKDE